MKFEQIKTYLVGVLKGWFTNKTVLDKLSVNESNFLLYDGSQVAGTGVLYRDETVLFEGEANASGDYELIDSVKNYDEIYVFARLNNTSDLNSNTMVINTNDISSDIGNNAFLFVAIADRYIGFNFSNGYDKITVKNISNVSNSTVAIAKIIGIKYKAKQSYSLEEQIVGTWIDGKPLYQKTIEATINAGQTSISLSDLNYDTMISVKPIITRTSGNIEYTWNDSLYSASDYTLRWVAAKTTTGDNLVFVSGTQYAFGEGIITLQYTKTTDAATITELN